MPSRRSQRSGPQWAPAFVASAVAMLVLLTLTPPLRAALSVVRDADGQIAVREGDTPILRYNLQSIPVPEGVTGIYAVARSDYIHPLYGPDGSVLTTDYSKDHPHHRGIYWAWPEVTYQGQTHDLHALQGVFSRPEKLLRAETDGNVAIIEAVNRWLWEDQTPIVRETALIEVQTESADMRLLDLTFTYEALEPGVTIARRGQSAYGGLNIRLSPREQQHLVTYTGAPQFPAAPSWGEVIGIPPTGTEPVGVLILQHPGNVSYPEDWIQYPELNWLQPAFPTQGTAYELLPEVPLTLRYRIVVRMGAALDIPYMDLWQRYTGTWEPFVNLRSYTFGHDTARLRKWERIIQTCPPAERAKAEPGLLLLLTTADEHIDLATWVCAQLHIAGSEAAVPALVAALQRPALQAPACQALQAIPGKAVDLALRNVFPTLGPEARIQVIAVMGARRDAGATDLLTDAARGESLALAVAAIQALGMTGSGEALAALLALPAERQTSLAWGDAVIRCLQHDVQQNGTPPAEARDALRLLLAEDAAIQHQAAALALLARVAPVTAMQTVLEWLNQGPVRKQRASAAALSNLPDETLRSHLLPAFPTLPTTAKLIAGEELLRRPGLLGREILDMWLKDPECSDLAARGLALIGGAGDVAALLQLCSGEGEAAHTARETLVGLQGTDVDNAIRDVLKASDPALRRLGADLLTVRLAAAAVPDMLRLIADPERKVARRALATLGDYARPEHVAGIIDQLSQLSPNSRADAYQALAVIGRRESDSDAILELLLQRTRDNPTLYCEVVGALDEFPSAASAALLTAVVQSPEPALAEAAARALLKWPVPPDKELLAAVAEADAKTPEGPLKPIMMKAHEHLALLATENLCKGKTVTTSHPWQGDWAPQLAVDGVVALNSYWSCAISPSSITVDLGGLTRITALRVVNYWDGGRFYQYTAEISADGNVWQTVADMSTNTDPATESGALHTFEPSDARFVRVTMLKNSANPGMHIVELEAFSSIPGKE